MPEIEIFNSGTEAISKLREYADQKGKSYQIAWSNESIPINSEIEPLFHLFVDEMKIERMYDKVVKDNGFYIRQYFAPYCWVKWNE